LPSFWATFFAVIRWFEEEGENKKKSLFFVISFLRRSHKIWPMKFLQISFTNFLE
jgi:hypothetical protein